jgi:hypothetical protein
MFYTLVTQGFDLADARLMIASALEDLAQALLEEGKHSLSRRMCTILTLI